MTTANDDDRVGEAILERESIVHRVKALCIVVGLVLFFGLWIGLDRLECGGRSYFPSGKYICCVGEYVCSVVDQSTRCCQNNTLCCSDGIVSSFFF